MEVLSRSRRRSRRKRTIWKMRRARRKQTEQEDDARSPSLLKHLLKGEGGAAE